ncbi:unnamed protein product [Citrullus colocynthis]|uniref:Uncharacterized protein n=1 Tax=Citrullus colocynthis TaxID=252529 RepID=A0ABP0YIS1_9ROSI
MRFRRLVKVYIVSLMFMGLLRSLISETTMSGKSRVSSNWQVSGTEISKFSHKLQKIQKSFGSPSPSLRTTVEWKYLLW